MCFRNLLRSAVRRLEDFNSVTGRVLDADLLPTRAQWVAARYGLADANIDDGRGNLFNQRRETGHGSALDALRQRGLSAPR